MLRVSKSLIAITALVSLIVTQHWKTLHAADSLDKSKPNIVFIFADDLGWTDLGCFGSSFYETPNLDRMAKQGVQLNQAYAACPVCSPTRASILTGLWPQRTGITDYIGAAQPDAWKRNTRMLPAAYKDRLDHSFISMAEVLKGAGYQTFFAGKWHLGPEGFWPEEQGFNINRGGIDRGGPYGGKKYFSPYGNPKLTDGPDGEHLPDRLASEACAFMEQNREQPFLVYFPFYSVHTPLMAREDLKKKYTQKANDLQLKEEWGREGERKVRLTQTHAVYAGMVEAMDQAVGKVIDKVDSLGLSEKTLIVFTSDNGGLSTSEGHPTSNLPLRGGKGWMYEGGIRVATLMRWTGKIPAGSVMNQPVSSPDWLPTVAAATQAQTPKNVVWDGVNLLPAVCEGKSLPSRSLYWHYPHYGNQGGRPGGAIRQGDWKLIEWYDDGSRELYNLKEDLGEQRNLLDTHSERGNEMAKQLRDWRDELRVMMPTKNPKFDDRKPEER